jgi:hypothetical protein
MSQTCHEPLTVRVQVLRELRGEALDLPELSRVDDVLHGIRDGVESRPHGSKPA